MMLDKPQKQIDSELSVLRTTILDHPLRTAEQTQQVLLRAEKYYYPRGIILAKVILAHCHWNNMSYGKGLKVATEAGQVQDMLDSDEFSSEINHIKALNHFGKAEYFIAQHHWNIALEQAALNSDSHIELEAIVGLGNAWRLTNETILSATAHQLAIDLANYQHLLILEKKSRILLAKDLYQQGDYLNMLMELDAAEELAVEHIDYTWQAEISNYRAMAMLELNRLLDADVATQETLELCQRHDLTWMSAPAHVARARFYLSQHQYEKVDHHLSIAERIAATFDNGEILAEIFLRRSQSSEEQGKYEQALEAHKQYRECSLRKYANYTASFTHGKAHWSKSQLDQRSLKLLHRLRQLLDSTKRNNNGALVPETSWWEKLILFKTQLNSSTHSVILIQCNDAKVVERTTQFINSIASPDDYLAILNDEYLGWLIEEQNEGANAAFGEFKQLIDHFPWERHALPSDAIDVSLHSLTRFPFTLEQLTQMGE
jgi:hypothetical protein